MRNLLALLISLSPGLAVACGGLFCDTANPVVQAAERILFAPGQREGTLQMHVQITWAGPPEEFGWLLPVPADVETGLSPAALFPRLDLLYTPRFTLIFECGPQDGVGGEGGGGGAGGQGGAGGGGEPGVEVLSRMDVGPYDQVVLRAADASVLLTWLDDNGFNAPDDAAEILQGYLDQGAAMLALKLLPSADSADVAPLWLEFTAGQPTIPLRPTALAAQPDMGIIVHIAGGARAVPTNYLHVEINEAGIDWFSGGTNYPDVVSQAADEAGGQAFATDFAGLIERRLWRNVPGLGEFSPDHLGEVAAAETLGDLVRAVSAALSVDAEVGAILVELIDPPDGVSIDELLEAWPMYAEHPVDGAAISARIAGLNADRARVGRIFSENNWISRLYTTMSPAEMQIDPLFDENPDLDPVSNRHLARFVSDDCSDGRLVLSDGREFAVRDRERGGRIIRQDGVTVRGDVTPAAARIERHFAAGQPELVEETPMEPGMQPEPPVEGEPDPVIDPVGADDDDEGGCGCSTASGGDSLPVLLGLLGVAAVRRRRRG